MVGGQQRGPREAVYVFCLVGRRGASLLPEGVAPPGPRGRGTLESVQLLSKGKTKEEMKLCGGNSALLSKDLAFTSTCTLQSLLAGSDG